jgi:hypothetical protein
MNTNVPGEQSTVSGKVVFDPNTLLRLPLAADKRVQIDPCGHHRGLRQRLKAPPSQPILVQILPYVLALKPSISRKEGPSGCSPVSVHHLNELEGFVANILPGSVLHSPIARAALEIRPIRETVWFTCYPRRHESVPEIRLFRRRHRFPIVHLHRLVW